MKYKVVPFNMTLAKRICDGSVNGKIYAMYNSVRCDVITYVKSLGINEVFEIDLPSRDEAVEVTFTKNGISTEVINHYALKLHIEIPVEDSYDEDVADVVEQKKDAHYHKYKIEPIEYILANNLGFCEGNIVKYITRYKDKGKPLDDLRKIKVYVDYIIDDLTKADGHQ